MPIHPDRASERRDRRRKDDPRFEILTSAISALKDGHANMNAKLDAVTADVAGVKRDTAAIIQEFVDRRQRQKALTFYSRSIECIMKRVVRPIVIVLLVITVGVYVVAVGHLPAWAKDFIEALR